MKAIKSKITLALLAIAITIAIVALVRYDMGHVQPDAEKVLLKDDEFGSDNMVWMKVDTFISLVTKAYHPNAETTLANNLLIVNIKNANTLAQDFYNGNEALLQFKINEHNFEISYDQHNKVVAGRFKIKDSLVAVPNDVLIKVVDKNIN